MLRVCDSHVKLARNLVRGFSLFEGKPVLDVLRSLGARVDVETAGAPATSKPAVAR